MKTVGRSSNGKTADSGSPYRGSSPCLPATRQHRGAMRLCLIPLLIPACLFAQAPQTASPQAAAPAASAAGSPADAASSPAPPEIDKALRERATSFLQYDMEGNFRKAYDLVAEESKDLYFSQTKPKFSSFKIEDIQYSDNFTAAVVRSAQRRTMTFQGQSFDFDLPATDTWRLVDGKWMWTHQE